MPAPDPSAILHRLWGLQRGSLQDAALNLLAEIGLGAVEADEASILVHDQLAGDLVFARTLGNARSDETLTGQRVPAGAGLVGLAMATGEVQVGAPLYDGVEQATVATATKGPAWVIAAPVLLGDDPIGVMTAVRFSPERSFSAQHIRLFGQIGALGGVLISLHGGAEPEEADDVSAGPAPVSGQWRVADLLASMMSRHQDQLPHIEALLKAGDALLGAQTR